MYVANPPQLARDNEWCYQVNWLRERTKIRLCSNIVSQLIMQSWLSESWKDSRPTSSQFIKFHSSAFHTIHLPTRKILSIRHELYLLRADAKLIHLATLHQVNSTVIALYCHTAAVFLREKGVFMILYRYNDNVQQWYFLIHTRQVLQWWTQPATVKENNLDICEVILCCCCRISVQLLCFLEFTASIYTEWFNTAVRYRT